MRFVFVALLFYAATFLVWSRARTLTLQGNNGRVWSFFSPPSGLPMLNPNRWSEWKQKEKTAAIIFWPCVRLDEKWTVRRYWPARFAEPPRLDQLI